MERNLIQATRKSIPEKFRTNSKDVLNPVRCTKSINFLDWFRIAQSYFDSLGLNSNSKLVPRWIYKLYIQLFKIYNYNKIFLHSIITMSK